MDKTIGCDLRIESRLVQVEIDHTNLSTYPVVLTGYILGDDGVAADGGTALVA